MGRILIRPDTRQREIGMGRLIWLEQPHAEVMLRAAMLGLGSFRVTEYGEENTYYVDEFDQEYYCKNL